VGDANANCPQIFKKYRSNSPKRNFKRKIQFFSGDGLIRPFVPQNSSQIYAYEQRYGT